MIRVVEVLPEQKRSKPSVTGIARVLSVAGLAVAMAALLALIPVSRAMACYCIGPSSAKSAERHASVAFVGVVAATALRTDDEPDRQDYYQVWPILYRFGVEEVIKGNPGDWIDIATGAGSAGCGAGFSLGSRWRVYASEDNDGVPVSISCSGNKLIDLVAPVPAGVPYPTASVPELAPLKLPSHTPARPVPRAADPTTQASQLAAPSDSAQVGGVPIPVIAGGAGLALLIALGGAWALRRRSARS